MKWALRGSKSCLLFVDRVARSFCSLSQTASAAAPLSVAVNTTRGMWPRGCGQGRQDGERGVQRQYPAPTPSPGRPVMAGRHDRNQGIVRGDGTVHAVSLYGCLSDFFGL